MPYVFEEEAKDAEENGAVEKGQLTYKICALMREFVENRGDASYDVLSDAAAACSDAEDEFRERVLRPYERRKRSEPGRVDPFVGL